MQAGLLTLLRFQNIANRIVCVTAIAKHRKQDCLRYDTGSTRNYVRTVYGTPDD